MDFQLWDEHLIYSVVIFRYWSVISEHSALLSKKEKQVNMNILDITDKYLNIKTDYIRWLSHNSISRYWSWISIFSVYFQVLLYTVRNFFITFPLHVMEVFFSSVY